MTPLYDTQEFYKKMLHLQDRLRKSEDERMKLEERFNLLSEDFRSRRETCINNLRMRYIDFLEEQRHRDERNHQILGALDKIDGSLARMTARTDRLGILRKQYEAYLLRVYANRNTEGGTGDSGVGSHNEDRSPKTNISPIEKNLPQTQRVVSQNADNPPSFIPHTKYPRSYIGAGDISQFNVPRYTRGQETPQVHVMPGHEDRDSSTIVQPERMPQLFYDSQSRNIPDTFVSKTQPMPSVSQEFISPNLNYPQQFGAEQFLRSSNQLAPNYAQVQHHQLRDIPNQYLANSRAPYAGEPSMVRSQKLPDSREMIHSDSQSLSALKPDRSNRRAVANFSDEAFDPYRQSTPLPGYLDYSTRYSRDSGVHDPNAALRYGFMRGNLEKAIDSKEQILPKDYLHNPETVKPAMDASKLALLLEDRQKVSDAKPSRRLNDDELDQYISRIRSLHRDNDQSLEALDIDQNTSGDLLNATLSDDEPEQHSLYSGDKPNPNVIRMVPDDVKSVFALADDFVAEIGTLGDESQLNSESLNDRKIPSKPILSPQICNVAKPAFTGTNDVPSAVLNVPDMTSDNLSISVTRDDILSGTASVGVNQMQDTSAIASGKFRPTITPQIGDIDNSRLNLTDVATVSQNNLVDSKEFRPNESDGHQVLSSNSSQEYLKMSEKRSNLDKKVNSENRTSTEVPSSCIQSVTKSYGFIPKETEIHEDIEGDKVRLVEGEQKPEQVIDVIRELQPPSLKHYEKNIVKIRVGDEDKKDPNARKVVPDGAAGPKIQGNEDTALRRNPGVVNVAETLSQDSIANKIYTECDVIDQKYPGAEHIEEQIVGGSNQEISKHGQYQNEAEPTYELNPDHRYTTYEHEPGQNLAQGADVSQTFEQNPEQSYDPGTIEQLDYDTRQTVDESNRLDHPDIAVSDEPYDTNRQYETDPSQPYVDESNSQFAYNSNPQVEDDLNQQYADNPNEQYATDPNEQYTSDPNGQYMADPNEQYMADPNEQYTSDPNEQYAAGSNEQYANVANEQYANVANEQYANVANEQYANVANEQYANVANEHYETDPNEGYTADPNEQYGYYQDQPYQHDQNATGENTGIEHYDYAADQGYQHDPNQQYEHDPNQQYEHDPSQQYEHDPSQQYEHDNESSAQDPNQEYKEHEYGQDQGGELVDYEEPEQGGIQQFENDSQQNYPGPNLDLQSSNQDYPTAAAAGEQNEILAAAGDSEVRDLSEPDDIGAEESSVDGGIRKKDVIRALLESDTDSTIERNPSNNTESDFNFN